VRWFQQTQFYSKPRTQEGAKVRRQGLPSFSVLLKPRPDETPSCLKERELFPQGRGIWRFLHSSFFPAAGSTAPRVFTTGAMVAMYEYLIDLKMRELERPWAQKTRSRDPTMLLTRGA